MARDLEAEIDGLGRALAEMRADLGTLSGEVTRLEHAMLAAGPAPSGADGGGGLGGIAGKLRAEVDDVRARIAAEPLKHTLWAVAAGFVFGCLHR